MNEAAMFDRIAAVKAQADKALEAHDLDRFYTLRAKAERLTTLREDTYETERRY